MPFTFTHLPEYDVLTVRLSLALTGGGIHEALSALWARPEYHSIPHLWDGRGVRELVVSPSDLPGLKEAIDRLREARRDVRTAVLLQSETHATFAMLLVTLARRREHIRVTASATEALSWLGLPPEAVDQLDAEAVASGSQA